MRSHSLSFSCNPQRRAVSFCRLDLQSTFHWDPVNLVNPVPKSKPMRSSGGLTFHFFTPLTGKLSTHKEALHACKCVPGVELRQQISLLFESQTVKMKNISKNGFFSFQATEVFLQNYEYITIYS